MLTSPACGACERISVFSGAGIVRLRCQRRGERFVSAALGSTEPEAGGGPTDRESIAKAALQKAKLYRAARAADDERMALDAEAMEDADSEAEDEEESASYPWLELDEEDADAAQDEGWTPESAEEAVARSLGLANADEMTELQKKYKDKLLEKVEAKRREAAAANYAGEESLSVGIQCYNMGRYRDAVLSLEEARKAVTSGSLLGGKIALWLGQALDAAGRMDDAVSLYESLEATHPISNIRRQAFDLRFIMQAPKLELRADERVSLPLLESADAYRDRTPAKGGNGPRAKKRALTLEEQFLENYRPPSVDWAVVAGVSATAGAISVAIAIFTQL